MPFLAPLVVPALVAGGAAIAGAVASDKDQDELDLEAAQKKAQMDALGYEGHKFNEDAYNMQAGSEWGSQQREQTMGQQLADVGQLNEARRQQMQGRGQQQEGLGLLGDSARGGGGNEMLRAFAAGEGDVAGALKGRAMGEGLIAEKVAAAQRDKLGAQIATQAASGRGGYDPASRRAAINAMSSLGQQGAAGTAALGAQEAAMAGQLYQGNRLAGASGYQKGMLGAQSAYAGALQGMRGQDIGVQGLEGQDVARQQAGTLGKMGIGQGYEQLGMEDKHRMKGAQQLLDKRQADEKARAMGIRMNQYKQTMADEQKDDDQTANAVGTGFAVGGKILQGVAEAGSDEDAKKDKKPSDIQAFLKSIKEQMPPETKADVGGYELSSSPGPDPRAIRAEKKFIDRGDPDTPLMEDAIKALQMGQPLTPEMKQVMFPAVPGQTVAQPGQLGAPPQMPQSQPLVPTDSHAGAMQPPMSGALQRPAPPPMPPAQAPSPGPVDIHAAASDEDSKTARTDAPIGEFLDPLKAETWEYKDKDRFGEGRRTGPMAQDLQRSQVGSQLVAPAEDGTLMVDYDPKRVGPIMLSALGHLNDRLEKLEG